MKTRVYVAGMMVLLAACGQKEAQVTVTAPAPKKATVPACCLKPPARFATAKPQADSTPHVR